jgi:predicted DNA-binding transcriptional regulator
MHRDKAIGTGLIAAGVAGILAYCWLVFFTPPPWDVLVLKITAFIAVAAILGVLAWVGYALATTPPPKPIEEIEREVQKALEEIERQMKEGSSGSQTPPGP